MAANMYRVGGEYRAQGLRGPGRERLRAGTEKLSPRRRGSERGPEPEPGSEGAGTATRPGAETLRELGQPRRRSRGCVCGPPDRGAGLGKVVPKELTGRGREGLERPLCHLQGSHREVSSPQALLCASVRKGRGPALV